MSASNSKGQLATWFRSPKASNAATDNETVTLLESINLPPSQMAKSLALMHSPCRDAPCGDLTARPVILVVGGVDSRCHLRLFSPSVEIESGTATMSFLPSIPVGTLTGHDDWVTCLTDGLLLDGDLYFASGAQDSKIRIWKITASLLSDTSQTDGGVATVSAIEEVDDEDEDEGDEEGEGQSKASGVPLSVSEETTGEARCAFVGTAISADGAGKRVSFLYAVALETLLVGHEDWVSSLHWILKRPSVAQPLAPACTRLRLFSTSMDRNMVIWEPDAQDGIWAPLTRIGDIGGNLGGSVGGNLLGFVGGCVGARHQDQGQATVQCIVGIGYGGSFHLWESLEVDDGSESVWRPEPFLTGHFGPVMDLVWGGTEAGPGSRSEYLLTVSLDQTCRMFVPLPSIEDDVSGSDRWIEISRPQVTSAVYVFGLLRVISFSMNCFRFTDMN